MYRGRGLLESTGQRSSGLTPARRKRNGTPMCTPSNMRVPHDCHVWVATDLSRQTAGSVPLEACARAMSVAAVLMPHPQRKGAGQHLTSGRQCVAAGNGLMGGVAGVASVVSVRCRDARNEVGRAIHSPLHPGTIYAQCRRPQQPLWCHRRPHPRAVESRAHSRAQKAATSCSSLLRPRAARAAMLT